MPRRSDDLEHDTSEDEDTPLPLPRDIDEVRSGMPKPPPEIPWNRESNPAVWAFQEDD